ncbi:hypothetical protein KAS45_01535, partial [candidate division WOR-3 bacterium]|nr:hypothetical protein [candidate division WOR-3 bacterium]
MIWLLFLLSIDPRYHTFNEVAYELDSMATHYSSITMLDTLGYTDIDSLPIFALKLSDSVTMDEDEPEILYIGCHHAEELIGIEICMYMIDDLISNYNIDSTKTHWINNREIWFVPLMNPDGHGVVMTHMDTIWRKNKRDNDNNGFFDLTHDGVDLNRNYDFYWSNGGSTDFSSEFYRGPYSFSESEARAIRNLTLAHNFTFCITYHSARYGLTEVVYYPWRWSGGYSPDYPFIRVIADTISKRIIKDSGTGHYTALVGQGLDGRARNWLYGICGIFTYCLEVGTTTIPPGSIVDDICQRNLPGAYYLLERVEESGITGCIYDSLSGEPVSAEVVINGYYDSSLPPRKSDVTYGRFLRILKPGVYDIEVRNCGYASMYYDDIVVSDGQMTELNVLLNRISGESTIPR